MTPCWDDGSAVQEPGSVFLYPPLPAAPPGLDFSVFGAEKQSEGSLNTLWAVACLLSQEAGMKVSLLHFHFRVLSEEEAEFELSLQSLQTSAVTQTPILTLLDTSYLCAHTQIILLWRMKAAEKQAPHIKSDFAHFLITSDTQRS